MVTQIWICAQIEIGEIGEIEVSKNECADLEKAFALSNL